MESPKAWRDPLQRERWISEFKKGLPRSETAHSSRRCLEICSRTLLNSLQKRRLRRSSFGHQENDAGRCTLCETMGPASTNRIIPSYSVRSNGFTRLANSRELGLGWRRCTESSAGMAERFGPKEKLAGARPSTSRSPIKHWIRFLKEIVEKQANRNACPSFLD